jgi:uncharacterized protein (TIGR02646 family)
MIKLNYPEKPAQLSKTKAAELTSEFDKDKSKSVWKKYYITEPLLKMSFGKCCFCESDVNEESKYMEVEHFHPKSLYPSEVVKWDNLLPICKRCNGIKNDHDTKLEPIIHPAFDNPKEYLFLKDFRLYEKKKPGKLTIDVVDLNGYKTAKERKTLTEKRFEIGEEINKQLETLLFDLIKQYAINQSVVNKNKIVRTLKGLLIACTPEKEYSATAATTLLTSPNYQEIKIFFESNNLWNDEFSELEQQVEFCALI